MTAAPTPDFNEKIVGKKVYWGDSNDFPQHLLSLYDRNSTLQSIIEGTVDYISGKGIINLDPKLVPFERKANDDLETLQHVVDKTAWNNEVFGGCFILVTRTDDLSAIGGLQLLDTRRCRFMSSGQGIMYLDVRGGKIQSSGPVFPVFSGWGNLFESEQQEVYVWRGRRPRGYYPIPRYVSALQEIDTQTRISKYYNALVKHNFTLSGVLTVYTDGMTDEQKGALHESMQETYGGEENGGKLLTQFLNSSSTADLQAKFTPISANDLDKQYLEVGKATKQAIFSAFRAVPALFGLMTETTGFSQQEFKEAFDLYSATLIKPRQDDLVAIFADIFNVSVPFTIEPLVFDVEQQTTV